MELKKKKKRNPTNLTEVITSLEVLWRDVTQYVWVTKSRQPVSLSLSGV